MTRNEKQRLEELLTVIYTYLGMLGKQSAEDLRQKIDDFMETF